MVRISGPEAVPIARNIFTPLGGWSSAHLEGRVARVGHVHEAGPYGERIDQAVLLFFPSPRSYTCEDMVELTVHGGPLILRALVEAVVGAGARLAEPGEFTKRAFLNGRMDLSQAEAVASLIFASTQEARRVMLRQVEGGMGREVSRMRSALKEVKVYIESAIDFPEDAEEPGDGKLEDLVSECLVTAEGLLETSREGIALRDGISVVIIGTPNVGKSSILNALLEEERAIVHEAAGTTRDFIEGWIDVNGLPMKVVDTAGVRRAAEDVEVEGVIRTRRMMDRADMLLVVLDSSRETEPGDKALLRETEGMERVVAANKSDLPTLMTGAPEGTVSVSAKTGQGIVELRTAIHDTFMKGASSSRDADGVVTTVRQKTALEGVHEACGRILDGLSGDVGMECLAVDLDEALMRLGALTGEVTVEEILGEIFSRFCIGK